MFDISFIELLVIFVVALVVFGPDKLPQAVRTGALWFGRFKRSFNKVKTEIEQQLNADDIRRELHNEAILAEIEQARKNADKLVKDTQNQLDKAQSGINKAINTANSPAIAVVTNSAEEGAPTYKTPEPEITESVPDAAPAAVVEPAAAAADDTQQEPTPAQDFYNTPPTGKVVLQGRKLMAPAPAPADDNKDS